MNNFNKEENNINEIKIEKKELLPGIILIKEYQQIIDDINYPDIEGMYIFKIQLNIMSLLHFDLYLDNSENILLENNELKEENKNNFYIKNIINPYETKIIAKILLKNQWKLKTKFKISLEIPSKSTQYQFIQNDEQKIKKNLLHFNSSHIYLIPFEFLSQNEINKKFKELKTKFIDIDFPPCYESIVNNEYKNDFNLDYVVHWRRPVNFINNEMIVESLKETNNILRIFNKEKEPEPNDIRQGVLSFNLLDSCISALTEKYNLIKRLFLTNNYNENGIYKIKLCHNGQWKIVIIDDYFPCIPRSFPLVSKSASNELYILTLEKALAKLFGSYYNLSLIKIQDFFLTLTGCPSISVNIKNEIRNDGKNKFFNKLKDYVINKKYIVVAISKKNEDNEIYDENENNDNLTQLTIPNYGYTILDIRDKFDPNVIILRKVWYNEKKEKLIDDYTNKIINQYPSLINDLNDNIIILTYDKFLSEFSSFAVCFTKNWEEIRLRGKFINTSKENYSIPISKWYYLINLKKQTNLIISLFQETNNLSDERDLYDISLVLLKYDFEKNEINLIEIYDFNITSNIQMELNLRAGNYIVYPRTSGCFFYNNIFNVKDSEYEKNIYDLESKSFSNTFINIIKNIFKKYDIYLNNCLSYEEFNKFYKTINNNESLSEKEYNIYIIGKYQSYNKSITEKGFIDFFKNKYLEQNGVKEIKKWLKNLGYNDKLISIKDKSFIITFHSDNEIKLRAIEALDTGLPTKIEKIILKNRGEIIKKNNNISVFKYHSKSSNYISYGILNNDMIPLRIVLIFKESENIVFSGNINHIEKIVQPEKYEFFLHLFYLKNDKNESDFEFNAECYSIQ